MYFKKAELYNAEWICAGKESTSPLIRKVIKLPQITSAKITVACLGVFEIYVNGKKVSDDLFQPLNTDFEKRAPMPYGNTFFDEQLEHRLYCPQYDLTDYLKDGENSVCFIMGQGWYGLSFGNIKLCYCLEYTDILGNIGYCSSDNTHKWANSFITENNMLKGETHDYRDYDDNWVNVKFDDSKWNFADIATPPETNLYIAQAPADKVCRRVEAKLILSEENRRIYDVGEIITGYPILRVKCGETEKITLSYGELLNKDGNLDKEHTYGQYNEFMTDGKERFLNCRFTWFGFRYFEVLGNAEVVNCAVIHSDVKVNSHFECDNEVLNWLSQSFIRTQLCNMHGSIPSDCPHAERLGYTGDGQLTCYAVMLQMAAKEFYKKWIFDIADCQDRKTGHVQYTAPFYPAGGGPGGWGSAIVTVPYTYYKHYGDLEICKELLPNMLSYFDYMENRSENGLVVSDFPGAWCLGDWCVPAMAMTNDMSALKIPAPLVNTYFYIKAMEKVLDIGTKLGLDINASLLLERIHSKKAAIIERYFNDTTGNFADNLQGSNVFAIDLGLGDRRTLENTVEHYRKIKKYDTGIFATDILTRILFERGYEDLAISLLTTTESGSFYSQMKNGGTTLAEYWTGHRSQCHPMFGAVTRYLYEYILGIRQTESSVCFKDIVIEPKCMNIIKQAKGYITTEYGVISVEYNRKHITVSVPEKVNGVLIINGKKTEFTSGETLFFN